MEDSILEEIGWSYSGLSEIVQNDLEAGKQVMCRAAAEYFDTLPKIEEAQKALKRLEDQRRGLLCIFDDLRKQLKLPSDFNFEFVEKEFISVHIDESNVELMMNTML